MIVLHRKGEGIPKSVTTVEVVRGIITMYPTPAPFNWYELRAENRALVVN